MIVIGTSVLAYLVLAYFGTSVPQKLNVCVEPDWRTSVLAYLTTNKEYYEYSKKITRRNRGRS